MAEEPPPEDVEPAETGDLVPRPEARRLPPDERAYKDVVFTEYEHSGPLPAEHWLEAVEALHAGSTQLILEDYRDQREHVRAMERKALEIDHEDLRLFARYQTVRLVMVGLLAAVIALGGIVLIAAGKDIAGLVVLVVEIAGLVAAFYGRDRIEKRAAAEDAAPDEGQA